VDARPAAARRRGPIPFPAILLVLAAILLAACAGPAAAPTGSPSAASTLASPSPTLAAVTAPPVAFPITVEDDEGTTVEIPTEPQRIVSLTPAATEVLFELGLGDRVVGKVEDFSLYPPEAGSVPDVAKFGSVDVEQIVGLETDLVIAGGSNFNPPEAIAQLRGLGVPTIVIFAPDFDTAMRDIELIGTVTGASEAAVPLVRSIRETFEAVREATADLEPRRVFYELDASSGYFGPAPDYFGTEMIRIAGGDPLTSGTDGVYQVEAEQIIAFDPEVILLGDAAYGVTPEQVAARPGWGVLTAVRNGDVRPIDDVIVTRPGPRLGNGIRALAVAIHPDLVLPPAAP
jgi:iron complex transport system substrate-binding protein